MFKITHKIIRYSKNYNGVRTILCTNNFGSVPVTAGLRNLENENGNVVNSESSKTSIENLNKISGTSREPGALIAAAFASLRSSDELLNKSITPFTDNRIAQAKTVQQILSISEGSGISRRLALKIVSVLADWSTAGKIQLSEFEKDPRFIRLCKILTNTNVAKPKTVPLPNEDWVTILNITADDEAAKLISSISLSQMVKVMSTLAMRKRRSTPLLRSLAFNIARSSNKLDLKQSADLLYSSVILTFLDTNLLDKVCSDVCSALQEEVKGTAVIGSILTSLGLLRYKDMGTLDALSKWILENHKQCRSQDIFSVFITLAILNHQPINAKELYEKLIPTLNLSEANKISLWLDIVWSLIVLNQAQTEHAASVLHDNFIKKIEDDPRSSIASKLKLLNIDSACDILLKNYEGPRLPDNSNIKATEVTRTKNKETLVSAMQDSLSNLVNPTTHLRNNVDTGMGFYIDAELILDKKCNPIPISKQTEINSEHYRVAVVVYDYHDMCHGRIEPTGINVLFSRLLEAKGYHVLTVPYTEFSPKDKLVNRVQYLESKLKSLIQF